MDEGERNSRLSEVGEEKDILDNKRLIPLMFFALIILVLPMVVQSSYLFTLFILVGIYTIIALGLSLLLGYAGQISIGHAAFYGIGAYTSGIMTAAYHVHPILALVCGVIFTAIIAYVVGIPTLKLKGHFLALATLGFNIIVYILLTGMDELTGGASGLIGIPDISVFGFVFSGEQSFYYLVWGVALMR